MPTLVIWGMSVCRSTTGQLRTVATSATRLDDESGPHWRLRHAPLSVFEHVRPLIANSDRLIVNLETCLVAGKTSPFEGQKNYLGWDDPERTLGVLKEIGVSAVSLANNHTMDFGNDGLLETIAKLKAAGTQLLSLGNFVFNSSGRYDAFSAPPLSLIARLDLKPEIEGWSSALKLYPIVTDNRRTGFQVQPVDRAMLASAYSLLAERAPDASAFRSHFELGEDERGLHIRLTRPISLPFAYASEGRKPALAPPDTLQPIA